ncbi:hypothetical protein FCH28_24900 [Streptomyces piniterrae]|uniref:Uncharacterized protein n=1 Tax=Streptomyces piniterrae TaxID=2571125 RepID=A0A4U0N775_9ACTN|nr:hypothetical protein [Streptomyces piniterrae]TJZ49540.1 hypothetical protein FCH28_24900 [Streptomyces piniterrae]
MATARSPFGIVRDRVSAVPLRALWLALLLFGAMIAHGTCTESGQTHPAAPGPAAVSSPAGAHAHVAAQAHVVTHDQAAAEQSVAPSPSLQLAEVDEGGGGVPAHHSAEVCVSGQPQQGAELPVPCAAPSTDSASRAPAQGRFGVAGGTSVLPPLSNTTRSVVQQV